MAEASTNPFSEYPESTALDGLSAKELQRKANDDLLRRLAEAFDGQAAAATFACGGAVPVSSCIASSTDTDTKNANSLRIQLRWKIEGRAGGIVYFPTSTDDNDKDMSDLIESCKPASFGLNGKDVIDESYRKAGKLDRSEFLTDFHPHDCGIIDSIRQILLPSMVPGGEGIGIGTKCVRAELYKLNVSKLHNRSFELVSHIFRYILSPSGKFNAHVDTPRGADNFGSLVVYLPYSHTGESL